MKGEVEEHKRKEEAGEYIGKPEEFRNKVKQF